MNRLEIEMQIKYYRLMLSEGRNSLYSEMLDVIPSGAVWLGENNYGTQEVLEHLLRNDDKKFLAE